MVKKYKCVKPYYILSFTVRAKRADMHVFLSKLHHVHLNSMRLILKGFRTWNLKQEHPNRPTFYKIDNVRLAKILGKLCRRQLRPTYRSRGFYPLGPTVSCAVDCYSQGRIQPAAREGGQEGAEIRDKIFSGDSAGRPN